MSSDGLNIMQTFRDMTGSTEEVASHWLEAANFDVETAISLFFSGGVGNGSNGTAGSSSSSGSSGDGMYDAVSSSSGMPPLVTLPSASNTASYLDYHNSTGARNKRTDEYDEDGVRRPDSVKKQRLMDDSSFPPHPDMYRSKAPPVSSFASAVGNSGNEKEPTLATLYRPPVDMYVYIRSQFIRVLLGDVSILYPTLVQ